MIILRSILFNTLFYANLIVWMLVFTPMFLAPRKAFIRVAQAWARSSIWLLRVVAGTRLEVRGTIPQGGLLVAAKHQSFFETFALIALLDDPAFILKRELMWIPFFGWYLAKAGMVAIDRKAGSSALTLMNQRAREEAAKGRQIMIFPEGTRRAPGAPPAYKFGVAHLYDSLRVPCLPVGLNSGVFWPRRKFLRRPGTLVIEFLEPIPPGLDRQTAFRLVQERIEASSDALLAEARAALPAGRDS